jgi:hypothetical protein
MVKEACLNAISSEQLGGIATYLSSSSPPRRDSCLRRVSHSSGHCHLLSKSQSNVCKLPAGIVYTYTFAAPDLITYGLITLADLANSPRSSSDDKAASPPPPQSTNYKVRNDEILLVAWVSTLTVQLARCANNIQPVEVSIDQRQSELQPMVQDHNSPWNSTTGGMHNHEDGGFQGRSR